ncbi:response regulator [Aquimarina brevivitae]|uniref:CheY-like chemotaxis protein n=1 Tax=Aquimarina brevivitae TaxID=323412 RepID=A0A4Q7PH40_9FLAO|nr:response regulator [Aquimarina brevivitae]RZS99856.1 CheY-like chemotaxis protein [Aquimarina brevivitae]
MDVESLKILLVEDNAEDVALVTRQIQKIVDQPKIEIATTLDSIKEVVNSFIPNIILCDYNLPTCSGMEVLELCRNISPATTFIFVTGTINDEELAANTILNGASGYLLKKNINQLHQKLRPYFVAASKNSPTTEIIRGRVEETRETIRKIEEFLKHASIENLSHQKGIIKIREDLKKLKGDYDS